MSTDEAKSRVIEILRKGSQTEERVLNYVAKATRSHPQSVLMTVHAMVFDKDIVRKRIREGEYVLRLAA